MSWFESFRRGPAVNVVGVSGDRVMFQTKRALPLGKVVRVRMVLPQGTFPARVSIQEINGSPGGGYLCTSRSDPCIPAPATSGRRLGLLPRMACRIKVCSPALPRFQVMSVDFSRRGLQVESLGPVSVGRVIPLSLYLDRPDLPILECTARVVWCGPRVEGCCPVGLEFWEPDKWAQGHLDRFELLLANRVLLPQ
ncbi:MAG: PilZ domain-containing protein [Armatimonadetes bacterium]|nr:PilZ domain-containing protein [Armatimonadota bacterium]